jgi:hypothetical protein
LSVRARGAETASYEETAERGGLKKDEGGAVGGESVSTEETMLDVSNELRSGRTWGSQ